MDTMNLWVCFILIFSLRLCCDIYLISMICKLSCKVSYYTFCAASFQALYMKYYFLHFLPFR